MGKIVLTALMITVLVSCEITYAQVKVLSGNELKSESGPQGVVIMSEAEGKQQKMQEIRQKIAELRALAREAQVKAGQFLAQAEELEQRLRQELQSAEVQAQIERLKNQVMELTEAAKRADKQGITEESQKLRKRIEELAAELKQRILDVEINRADETGTGNVEEKRIEIRRIRQGEQEYALKEQQLLMEELHAMLAELEVGIERAVDSGQEEWAQELQQKADDIRAQIKMHAHEMGAHRVRMEIEELHDLAEKQQELGHIEEAEELRYKAQQIEMAIHEEEMNRHMEQLHVELDQAHQEMERATRAGHEEAVIELERHIEKLHGEIARHEMEMERRHVEIEIDQLHRLAEREHSLGNIDKAEMLRREAYAIEQRLHQEMEVEVEEELGGLESVLRRELGKMHDMINDMRGEIENIRQEIEALKKKIRG